MCIRDSNGVYQPIFSVIAKNANLSQKEEFLQVIQEVLEGLVRDGIDRKALEAGINYHEFRYREADFGGYPKGLMYGLQILDSWLYDDEKPFIHVDALDVFAFLKEKLGTGYYEELIRRYLLENPHGAVVIVEPEQGRTAWMREPYEADQEGGQPKDYRGYGTLQDEDVYAHILKAEREGMQLLAHCNGDMACEQYLKDVYKRQLRVWPQTR